MGNQGIAHAVSSPGGGASLASGGTINGNLVVTGTLDVTGVATFTTTVTGSGNIMAGAAFALGFTGRGQFKSSADGVIGVYAADGATGGVLRVADGTLAAPAMSFISDTNTGFGTVGDTDRIYSICGGAVGVRLGDGVGNASTCAVLATGFFQWSSGASFATIDTQVGRSAAAVVGLYGASASLGSSLALASDKFISFSGTTDPDGTADTRLGWATTNALRIVNNSNVTVNLEHYIAYFANGSSTALRGAIYCSNTNVFQVATSATTGPAALLSSVLVEANTAGSGSPNVLGVLESKTVLTNEGTTAENYHTLPAAAAGLEFRFFVQDADGIRVTAGSGDTIRVAAGVSGAAGFVRCATQGAVVCLLAINATEWVAMYQTGVWTVDV